MPSGSRARGELGVVSCLVLTQLGGYGFSPTQEEPGRREEPRASPTLLPGSVGLRPGRG